MGFQVETGKGKANKIRRPVLYGAQGTELVSYEIDGWHDDHGIVLEIEAGRGALGNAVYRDLIRTPLIVDARFLVLGVMIEYHYKSGGKPMAFPQLPRRSQHPRRNLREWSVAASIRGHFAGRLLIAFCQIAYARVALQKALGRITPKPALISPSTVIMLRTN